MKKLLLTSLLLITAIAVFSCKTEKKKEKEKPAIVHVSLDETVTKVNWTSYKTTDKVPVKGTFNEVKITNVSGATTAKEALNGLKFSIPVSSIFSNDSIRDGKLKKFFFGVMKQTDFLTGSLSVSNDQKGVATITMNGITENIDIAYAIDGQKISIQTTLDLEKWDVKEAIEALNKACFDKHKGLDGISKTWNEVTLDIASSLIFK